MEKVIPAMKLFKVVFGWCSIRISAGIADMLSEALRDFPHSLEANAWIMPQLGHNHFFPKPLQSIVLSFDAVKSAIPKTS
jgi:hypothetical protein